MDCSNLLSTLLLSQERGTNFCKHIHRIDLNKSPLKILGKVAVGVELAKILRAPTYFYCDWHWTYYYRIMQIAL